MTQGNDELQRRLHQFVNADVPAPAAAEPAKAAVDIPAAAAVATPAPPAEVKMRPTQPRKAPSPPKADVPPRSTAFALPANTQYGGFRVRLIATAIDGILLWIVEGLLSAIILGPVFAGIDPNSEPSMELLAGALTASTALIVAIDAAYHVGCPVLMGAHLGKLLLGYRIVDAGGHPLSWGKSILRYLGTWVSALALWLGFFWIMFDGRNQGWHDKIAETYVIKPRQLTAREIAELP